jgi:branched-chain amino acid transport system substrate-binding protein
LSTRRKLSYGACALAVGLLAAACSSSNKSATSSTTAGSTGGTASGSTSASTSGSSTAQATGAPIKVGLVCSCSGPFGTNIVPVRDVYSAWVQSVNASGGINGHPIQLTIKDDAATPGTSVSDVQTLLSSGVDAIADMSIVDEPWAATVQKAGVPVVGIDVTEDPFFQNPDFYPEGQTTNSATFADVTVAKEAGATNFGYLYCSESVSCAETGTALKAAAKEIGLPFVYSAEVAMSAPNYTAQCVAAKQAHVTAIQIGDGANVLARVANDCATQGYYPIWIEEGEGQGPSLFTGAISKNMWASFNDIPYYANTPAIQTMNAAVDKYYPGLRNSTLTWSELAMYSWPSGILLEDAVKAGGLTASDTPSAAEIVKGLESLHGDTLQGMAPPLTFAAGQTHSINCWFTSKIVNGVKTLVDNGQVSCQNGSSS